MTQEALTLALEALYPIAHNTTDDPRGQAYKAITAIKKALAHCPDCGQLLGDAGHIHTCSPQPEQEPVAWEQFYPDIGKPQIEQPKVRTGDCLLVGVCASEGHKIQAKQEPWKESASDYERGFVDGMQKQMQSSVDKAVNQMAQPEREPATYSAWGLMGGDGFVNKDSLNRNIT